MKRTSAKQVEGSASVQSVERAIQLLSLFAPRRVQGMPVSSHRTEWSVGELARETGLHKSIVSRLMSTMARYGFVTQSPYSKTYRIGPQAFAVGASYESGAFWNNLARPIMNELTTRCGHASYLGVPSGRHYVIVTSVESIRSIRVTIEVGEQRTFNAGAIGKVLLAGMSDSQIREVVGPDPLPTLTPATIRTLEELLKEVDEVRRAGVAFNRDESIIGAGSVAVGIPGVNDGYIAGLAVVYPTHITSDAEISEITAMLLAARDEIARLPGLPDAASSVVFSLDDEA